MLFLSYLHLNFAPFFMFIASFINLNLHNVLWGELAS